MIPTADRIRELFDYDSEQGILKRKFNRCGIVCSPGVKVDGKSYPTANIAWLHFYGEWPPSILDHKDRNRYNYEIENLRPATCSQNGMNQERHKPHGLKGITFCPDRVSKQWRAQIRIEGIKVNLGRFATKEEAYEAYCLAAEEYHGQFACTD